MSSTEARAGAVYGNAFAFFGAAAAAFKAQEVSG